MIENPLPRIISFEHDRERVSLDAATALSDRRLLGRPIILLGEAGSGKSELLCLWANGPAATARQIINGKRLRQGRQFVDGLDEAPGLKNGDALHQLLGVLEISQNTDFVIACRIADWRSASNAATIKGWTGVDPVEIKIEPLGPAEVTRFLHEQSGLSRDETATFVGHYEQLGLGDWLGNPQTLSMLARVARDEQRPETASGLFLQYVQKTWIEPRRQDTPLAWASQQTVLSALGALFAAIIIGGYDALTLSPGATRKDNDLPLADCMKLPGIDGLTRDQLDAFLGSRLVAGAGQDRLTYQHRRIGEYLGALWLAAQAKTEDLIARLFGALTHDGLVPSNLRGLWGWLGSDLKLGPAFISTDPLAVIEYGDADTLNVKAAKSLLTAIERCEDEHQQFGWHEYRAAALLKPELCTEVKRVLAMPEDQRFWSQRILLGQMRDTKTVLMHKAALMDVMLDETRSHGLRRSAADALANHGMVNNWDILVQQLASSCCHESLRLSLDIMRNPNVGVTLDDADFAETVFAYAGLTPRFTGRQAVGTIGLYCHGPRKAIGDDRLDGILNELSKCADKYLTEERNPDAWEIERLFLTLLHRRIEIGHIDADSLWMWLKASSYSRYGTQREEYAWLDKWLRANDDTRRELQRKAIDSTSEEQHSLRWQLYKVAQGLYPTEDDVVSLLEWVPSGDSRWHELIWISPPREEGERARAAAERHVRSDEDRQVLLRHANPPPPTEDEEHLAWEKRQKRLELQRAEKLRADYLVNRKQMRDGYWGALAGPAHAYMGRIHGVNADLPPQQRIGAWIGEDLQADALVGFEAFLLANPPNPPTALQIAESHAEDREWRHALILSAALAERKRTGRGFSDLPTERVQAGLFAERVTFFDDNQWEDLRSALIAELANRKAWYDTACLFIEPQLNKHRTYVSWLWRVLASDEGPGLAAKWLQQFSRIAAEPEEALIDQLLRDGSDASQQALTEVAKRRRKQSLDARRKSTWQAVELILGTLNPAKLPTIAAENHSFIWTLRDRFGHTRRSGSNMKVDPRLLAATVISFSPFWPLIDRPSGVTRGDDNPFDAGDFLVSCLNSLAANPSAIATAELENLRGIDYGYAWNIKYSIASQRRTRANSEWLPHRVDALENLVTNGPPVDHADFQRVALEELSVVQTKIRSSGEDVWRFFYADASNWKPNKEDQCSDALVTLLKQTDRRSITFEREEHLGDDREGDIWCRSGELQIAIECKRHWHADLWTAFDWQLAKQQAVDWRAKGYGIYIVYWFGEQVHSVTSPPRHSSIAKPRSAEELETALRHLISDTGLPGIAVKVLDVSRSRR